MPDAVQKPDVSSRVIVGVGIVIIVTILLAALAAWLMWHAWNPARLDNGPNAPFDFGLSGALLESAPQPALKAFLADKERRLNSWGWVDRQTGVAHIPIEEAMRLSVHHGAPDAGTEKKQ